ncbi:MAG: ATP-binding cassette domain-containing protein [Mongoliitalea sp.]
MLLQLYQVSVHQGQKVIFENLNFTWSEGEHWAIIGEEGQVLTDFLQVLLGNRSVVSGIVARPFAQDYVEEKSQLGEVHSFRDLIAYVGQDYPFRNKSNLQNFYYQQRFNSMDSEDTVTVEAYLKNIPKRTGFWTLTTVIQLLHLEQLQQESLIKLSNGESRRLAIASALIQQPKLLVMDHPMTGLDLQTRVSFDQILKVIQASGVHLLMSTIPTEIPESFTRIALLQNRCLEVVEREAISKISSTRKEFHAKVDKKKLRNLLESTFSIQVQYLIRLEKVSIRYGEKWILHELSWEVKPKERWLLQGPNGAGKSTLISLLIGEHPQAYANDIFLFDRKRGTGESIWDVKKPIGFVAPELSRFFPRNQTVWKVLLSGFFDSMGLFKKPSQEQEARGIQWLEFLQMKEKAQIPFHQLPLAEQRMLLLCRALIKSPQLLIIDEGAQGLETGQRLRFKRFLEAVLEVSSVGLIYVSHYDEDIPDGVTKALRLNSI